MLNDLANRVLAAGVSVMGEPITLTRGAASYQLKGLFQDSFKAMDPETGMPVTSLQPVVGINTRDLEISPKVGDTITARGIPYRVRDVQPDGHTGTTLMLQRTSARG